MSSIPADKERLSPSTRESRDHESQGDAPGDPSEAILMLAEWMMDDLAALAESFRLDPNDLFREAVGVFAEVLGSRGTPLLPELQNRETH